MKILLTILTPLLGLSLATSAADFNKAKATNWHHWRGPDATGASNTAKPPINWSEEKKNAYIYGTLRKTGWKPSTQKAFKGGLITRPRLAKRGY